MSRVLSIFIVVIICFSCTIQPSLASEIDNVFYASDIGINGNTDEDVSSALQDAVNSIEDLGGGTIYFDSATYIINRSISLPSNINLIGNKTVFKSTTILNGILRPKGKLDSQTNLAIDAEKGQSYIRVANASMLKTGSDIIIMGSKDDLTGDNNFEFNYVIDIQGNDVFLKTPLSDNYNISDGYLASTVQLKDSIAIDGIEFIGSDTKGTCGVNLRYCQNVNITNCKFTNFENGIFCEQSQFINLENNYTDNIKSFIHLRKTKNSTIIKNTATNAYIGIRVHVYSDNVQVKDNIVDNVTMHGILYNDWNDNGIISGNTISHCGEYGLCHDKNNRYTLIEKNDISYTGKTALAVSSTIIDDCYLMIRDNYIHDTESYGFTFEVVSNSVFSNNYLKNIGRQSRDRHGIVFIPKADNQSSNNAIIDNRFENILGECIKMSKDFSTTNNTIQGNEFINSYRGITCTELSSNVDINNNKFLNIYRGVIYSVKADGITLASNDFVNVDKSLLER